MAIAGKVAITPKGEWNAQTAYTKLDLVFYDNASYVAIQPSTGVEPTNESYWMLMVQSAGGADLEAIIDGTQQVGNAKTLDGHGADYFAPLADLAKYLPLTGGTVETAGAQPLKLKNTVGTLCFIPFIGNSGNLGYFGFSGANNAQLLDSSGTLLGSLLHTGNKPTGTYTGNGSATSRTINTGGIGKVLYVSRSAYSGIVFGAGGLLVKNDGTITGLSYNQAHFDNGKLVLATDGVLNENGIEITYNVV